MKIGILKLKPKKILYNYAIWRNPKSKKLISVKVLGRRIDSQTYYIQDGNIKMLVNEEQLGSLIVLTHGNRESLIYSDMNMSEESHVNQANLLYCNGHRAIKFVHEGSEVKPISLCHEKVISI